MCTYLKMLALAALVVMPTGAAADDIDDLLALLDTSISGERARDYTMRLWRWDKWNDLPAWNGTAREAQAIMQERGFDEALVVDTPADGVTKFADWTNPVGWDVTAATLEVVEPAGLPAEYRYLCDYSKNPASLTFFSAPTPPNGIEAELFLYENMRPGDLATHDVRGKIILTAQSSGSMKRYLAPNGIPGMVTAQIERNNIDFVNAVQWQNTWSDLPGGWVTTATDDKSTFCFGISPKQGEYLRNLLRSGRKVKVRAVVDSRYYTDGSLPYITGAVHGTMGPEKDVLIVGHCFEYGANDNCTGCASFIEAIGTINDLIRAGKLPRPRRTLRVWMGFERYGSLAYTQQHIERLRTGTLASLCCDTPAADYDLATTGFSVAVDINVCPSFTDALLPEIAGRYCKRTDMGCCAVPFGHGQLLRRRHHRRAGQRGIHEQRRSSPPQLDGYDRQNRPPHAASARHA